MSKMAELYDEGVTDLISYTIGVQSGLNSAIAVLNEIMPYLTEHSSAEEVLCHDVLDAAITTIRGKLK